MSINKQATNKQQTQTVTFFKSLNNTSRTSDCCWFVVCGSCVFVVSCSVLQCVAVCCSHLKNKRMFVTVVCLLFIYWWSFFFLKWLLCCSMLQYIVLCCVAVCCSHFKKGDCLFVVCLLFVCWWSFVFQVTGVLQCVAVCCSVMQCVVLQCVAVCCSVLQSPKINKWLSFVCCYFFRHVCLLFVCWWSNLFQVTVVLQCVAVCCSVLQCVAVCCTVL